MGAVQRFMGSARALNERFWWWWWQCCFLIKKVVSVNPANVFPSLPNLLNASQALPAVLF